MGHFDWIENSCILVSAKSRFINENEEGEVLEEDEDFESYLVCGKNNVKKLVKRVKKFEDMRWISTREDVKKLNDFLMEGRDIGKIDRMDIPRLEVKATITGEEKGLRDIFKDISLTFDLFLDKWESRISDRVNYNLSDTISVGITDEAVPIFRNLLE